MMYRIGEIVKKLNISAHTLRYYENEGLIPPIDRDKNGNRIFKTKDLVILNTMNCLKSTGMPLKDIKQYIEWCSEGESTAQKRYELFLERKKFVEDQIDFLKNLLKTINYKCDFYVKAINEGKTEFTVEEQEEIVQNIMGHSL